MCFSPGDVQPFQQPTQLPCRDLYGDLFTSAWPPEPLHKLKAVTAIMRCRTAEMGGHVIRCPHGHIEEVHYNVSVSRITSSLVFAESS